MSSGTDLKTSSIEPIMKFATAPTALLMNPSTTPKTVPDATAHSVIDMETPRPLSMYKKSFVENSLTKFIALIPEQFSVQQVSKTQEQLGDQVIQNRGK
jgi:hypothetical protein